MRVVRTCTWTSLYIKYSHISHNIIILHWPRAAHEKNICYSSWLFPSYISAKSMLVMMQTWMAYQQTTPTLGFLTGRLSPPLQAGLTGWIRRTWFELNGASLWTPLEEIKVRVRTVHLALNLHQMWRSLKYQLRPTFDWSHQYEHCDWLRIQFQLQS